MIFDNIQGKRALDHEREILREMDHENLVKLIGVEDQSLPLKDKPSNHLFWFWNTMATLSTRGSRFGRTTMSLLLAMYNLLLTLPQGIVHYFSIYLSLSFHY